MVNPQHTLTESRVKMDWTSMPISSHEGLEWVRLGEAAAPTGNRWQAKPVCSTLWQVPRLSAIHAKLDHSIP